MKVKDDMTKEIKAKTKNTLRQATMLFGTGQLRREAAKAAQ